MSIVFDSERIDSCPYPDSITEFEIEMEDSTPLSNYEELTGVIQQESHTNPPSAVVNVLTDSLANGGTIYTIVV